MKKYTLSFTENDNGKIIYNEKNEGFRESDIIGMLEIVKIDTACRIRVIPTESEVEK